MAAQKSQVVTFTAHPDGAAEAAAVRRTIEQQQKRLANTNLTHLRFLVDVSREDEPESDMMADGLLAGIAEEEHPEWRNYDPLMRVEHIHRYPLDSSMHVTLLPMVTSIYSSIAGYLQRAIDARKFDTTVEDALRDLVDVSGTALAQSERRWDFVHPAYPTIQFVAHQLLVAYSRNVKLFVIVANGSVPYDYFFYFF